MVKTAAVLGMIGVMATATVARADHEGDGEFPTSASLGPTVGISWGTGVPLHLIIGGEAGFGFNPLLYGNAGVTYRNHELFSYVELDGWYLVGATLGVGYGTFSEWQAVAGIWEALPLTDNGSVLEQGDRVGVVRLPLDRPARDLPRREVRRVRRLLLVIDDLGGRSALRRLTARHTSRPRRDPEPRASSLNARPRARASAATAPTRVS